MSNITKKNFFTDNGESDRSSENFQHHLFKDIDFEQRADPISFFRSDFRGVKMEGMKFYHNNFDRADIINAFITDSQFKECQWGTDFVNTMFTQTGFIANMFDTCTIHNCYFEHCKFTDERMVNTSNRDSTYKSCSFKNCTFEMNTFNDLNYTDCKFNKVDLSNMGAYDLTFENCRFNQLTVNPDYFGSYLFKNTPIEDITYAYRGSNVALSGNMRDDLQSLALFYQEKQRYYEAFNTTLLFRYYLGESVSVTIYFQNIVKLILSDTNNLIKQEQLGRIVKVLIFYADSEIISADEIFYFIGYLKEINVDFFSLKDRLSFINNIDLLAKTVEAYIFDIRMISPALNFEQVYAEIQIEETDLENFKTEFDSFFSTVMQESGKPAVMGYHIVGIRKGSLIVELIGYAIGFYVLATILKSSVGKLLEIRMEYQLFQKAHKLIDEEINTINDLSTKTPAIRKIMSQPADEIFKKAKPLSLLMKQFHIFPNALLERRKIG